MLKKFPEVFAFGIVGIELEPRHNLHVRVGALSLNLYAVVEALTQAIVLAVVNRLADMATRGVSVLGVWGGCGGRGREGFVCGGDQAARFGGYK